MLMSDQYEEVSVEREASIQGGASEVIATGVSMLISPVRTIGNPEDANIRPASIRYRADVEDKAHAGVSDIARFDIIQATGREFLIIDVQDAVGTDVLQLELEQRDA